VKRRCARGGDGGAGSGEATSSSLLNKDETPILLKRRGRRFSDWGGFTVNPCNP